MSFYYIYTRWYIQIIFARKYSKLRIPVNTSLHLLAIMDIILTFWHLQMLFLLQVRYSGSNLPCPISLWNTSCCERTLFHMLDIFYKETMGKTFYSVEKFSGKKDDIFLCWRDSYIVEFALLMSRLYYFLYWHSASVYDLVKWIGLERHYFPNMVVIYLF